jgi:hypothetical protein
MKTYLTYGLAMAVAGAMLAIALYLLGFHSDPARFTAAQILGTVGGIIIGSICITLGTRARRAEVPLSEDFGYGRALGTGVMIALVASLAGIVTSFIYVKFINPGFVDMVLQVQIEKLEAKGMKPAQIEAAEKMMRTMAGPIMQAVSSFFGGMVMGTLISLVTAACLRRPAERLTDDSPVPPPIVNA